MTYQPPWGPEPEPYEPQPRYRPQPPLQDDPRWEPDPRFAPQPQSGEAWASYQPAGYPPGYGYQPPPPPRPPRRKRHRGLKFTLGVVGGFFVIIIIASVASGGGTSGSTGTNAAVSTTAPAPSQAAAAAPVKPARQTVTYVVNGSPADVTYGPDGSDASGTVPMRVKAKLGHPQYYAITAQLNESGTVSCKILIDGKVISRATASGAYEIADCEADQNPLTGQWEDTNSS